MHDTIILSWNASLRQTDRQTDRRTDRRTNRQTDRQLVFEFWWWRLCRARCRLRWQIGKSDRVVGATGRKKKHRAKEQQSGDGDRAAQRKTRKTNAVKDKCWRWVANLVWQSTVTHIFFTLTPSPLLPPFWGMSAVTGTISSLKNPGLQKACVFTKCPRSGLFSLALNS